MSSSKCERFANCTCTKIRLGKHQILTADATKEVARVGTRGKGGGAGRTDGGREAREHYKLDRRNVSKHQTTALVPESLMLEPRLNRQR